MDLAALSCDEALDRPLRGGRVLAVFRRACAWQCEDGSLTSVLSRELAPLPMAIRLATPEGFAFSDHVAAGQPVAVRAGMVRFAGSDLCLDTRPAEPWSGRIECATEPADADAIERAWDIIEREAPPSALAFALDKGSPVRALPEPDAARRLVGLGAGLTPSGDDVLVGYLAALRARADGAALHRALGEAVKARLDRTNAIAATYLRAAIDGRVGSVLQSAARARVIDRHVRPMLAFGHESGACTMIGLLLGLDPSSTQRRPC